MTPVPTSLFHSIPMAPIQELVCLELVLCKSKVEKIDETEPECATCAATLLPPRRCTEITFLPRRDIEFAPSAQYWPWPVLTIVIVYRC